MKGWYGTTFFQIEKFIIARVSAAKKFEIESDGSTS